VEGRSRPTTLPAGGTGLSKLVVGAVIAGGVSLAVGIDVFLSRRLPQHRLAVASATLMAAAAVYPLARRRPEPATAAAQEWLAVVAAIGVGGLSHLLGRRRGRALVATGWAAHAVFGGDTPAYLIGTRRSAQPTTSPWRD
jgi:hypothetical protein